MVKMTLLRNGKIYITFLDEKKLPRCEPFRWGGSEAVKTIVEKFNFTNFRNLIALNQILLMLKLIGQVL